MTGWLKYQHSDRWHRVDVTSRDDGRYWVHRHGMPIPLTRRDVLVVVMPGGA